MKKIIIVFLFLFNFQSWTKADDIRDFEIEGMSIGDSLLLYMTKEEIDGKKKLNYPGSKKFIGLLYISSDFKTYEVIQVHIKSNDKNYIIYEMAAKILYKNNINDCYPKKDLIVKELTELLKDAEINDVGTLSHDGDKSGESKTTQVLFEFKSGAGAKVGCFDWSKKFETENKYIDNLNVSIGSKEAIEWFRKEAFK